MNSILKKIIFIFLALVFGMTMLALAIKARQSAAPVMVSLPPPQEVTPLPSPTLPPVINLPKQEAENDLDLIKKDLTKMKEDQRLKPPEFIFDLEIKQD